MAKDIPYDQKYYDPEIECMPRPELEALQLEDVYKRQVFTLGSFVLARERRGSDGCIQGNA